jgi:sulfate permease, SulP family
MAFAIASGLPPQAGIYCAVTTRFLISALGGSRYQIGGPTGAFVVVVAAIVARYGVDGLFMCTMMAGVILIVAGLFGFGTAVRFIPRPVVVGFTNGIALVIASTQIRDFFGLQVSRVPGEFVPRLRALLAHAPTWSPATTALATLTLVAMIVAIRFIPPCAALYPRARRRKHRRRPVGTERRDHRIAIRRHPRGLAGRASARVQA